MLLSELFRPGDMNNEYCIKSRKAFSQLSEIKDPKPVPIEYKAKYNARDCRTSEYMLKILTSERNTMSKGIDFVLRKEFTL